MVFRPVAMTSIHGRWNTIIKESYKKGRLKRIIRNLYQGTILKILISVSSPQRGSEKILKVSDFQVVIYPDSQLPQEERIQTEELRLTYAL